MAMLNIKPVCRRNSLTYPYIAGGSLNDHAGYSSAQFKNFEIVVSGAVADIPLANTCFLETQRGITVGGINIHHRETGC